MSKNEILENDDNFEKKINDIIRDNKDNKIKLVSREENKLLSAVENDTLEVVNQINSLTLITPEDVKQLKEAQAFLLSTYTDVPKFRPMAVKLTSVLVNEKFATPDAKYWQCKSEAEVHFNELVREYYKYEKALVDLEELEYKIKSIESLLGKTLSKIKESYDPELINFDLRRLKIRKAQYEFELKQLEKTIKYRIEEITDWHRIAEGLKAGCKFDLADFEKHFAVSHFKHLEYKVKEATDENQRANFKSQLDTFKSIIEKRQ